MSAENRGAATTKAATKKAKQEYKNSKKAGQANQSPINVEEKICEQVNLNLTSEQTNDFVNNVTPVRHVQSHLSGDELPSGVADQPTGKITQALVKSLYEQAPELFYFVRDENPPVLRYEYDIFTHFQQTLKGQFLDLKESVIPETDGKEFKLIIDNDTRRIAMQQRRKLGVTLPELFRHAIWTYMEILVDRPNILTVRTS